MLKVLDQAREDNGETLQGAVPTLDALAREGARRMLAAALEEEVAHYIEVYADACDGDGPAAGGPQWPCAVANGDLRGRDDAGACVAGERPAG